MTSLDLSSAHAKTIHEILGRHPIHPFPARMAPGIALEAIGESKDPLRVLDPMVGSGTVLAVARKKGHQAIGIDSDPLAVLLSRVWTQTVDADEVTDKAEEVWARAKDEFKTIAVGDAYPSASDMETRAFVRYWFDDYARRQLAALARTIARVRNESIRDVLWCGLSRLIIAKQAGASLAMDLAHSRPHKEFKTAPTKPFNKFIAAVEFVAKNCVQKGDRLKGPPCVVDQGDARELSIADGTIDLVVTSPPYLNAIDYLRCSKFSLVWLGHRVGDLRSVRADSVGTEASSDESAKSEEVKQVIARLELNPKLPSRNERLLARYVWDMKRAMSEAARVLKPGGRAVYVVGDCTVRGTFIRNSVVLESVGVLVGLTPSKRHERALPANRRYLPPPKRESTEDTLDGRMRTEVVLTFSKLDTSSQLN